MEAREQGHSPLEAIFSTGFQGRSSITWPPSSSLVSPGLPITSGRDSHHGSATLLTTC